MYRGHLNPPNLEPGTLQRTMQRLACDVVPIGQGLIVDQKYQAVVQSPGAELKNPVLDPGSKTDSAVANRSEGYQVWLAGQLPLGQVVISHLVSQQCPAATAAPEYQKRRVRIESGIPQKDTPVGNTETLEEVGPFQVCP